MLRRRSVDLLDLSILLRNNWKAIENKTPVQLSELDEAHRLSDRLLTADGAREHSQAVIAEAAKIRYQAFTLLVKVYDQARRAITFVLWNEEEVDAIAPTLYSARQAGRR